MYCYYVHKNVNDKAKNSIGGNSSEISPTIEVARHVRVLTTYILTR